MSEKLAMEGFGSTCAPVKARLFAQSSLASACGSIGVPSAKAAAMSTCSAASARSMVSVAVHIANRKPPLDRKSTRLNSSHGSISYAVFCLKKKKEQDWSNKKQPYV